MKRSILHLTVLSATILLVFSNMAYAQDWKEHIDEKASVRFSLPSNWSIQTQDDGNGGYAAFSFSPDKQMTFVMGSGTLSVNISDQSAFERNIRTLVSQLLKGTNIRLNTLVVQTGTNNNIKGGSFFSDGGMTTPAI